MQSLQSTPMAHEAEEYPAMSESTTDIRIVPLPTGQDVLSEVLRDSARRMLAQAVEAEVAAWIDTEAQYHALRQAPTAVSFATTGFSSDGLSQRQSVFQACS